MLPENMGNVPSRTITRIIHLNMHRARYAGRGHSRLGRALRNSRCAIILHSGEGGVSR